MINNMLRSVAACAVVVCLASTLVMAQDSAAPSTTDSLQRRALAAPPKAGLESINAIDRFTAPAIDLAAVRAEDEQRDADGLPPRFAIVNDVYFTPADSGTWEVLEGDTLIWRLRVSSPGAISLNFGFTQYKLPPGAALNIYAADGSYAVRTFTGADNQAHGELWTPVVLSDDAIIQLTIPNNVLDHLSLELTAVNHGYRYFGEERQTQEAGPRAGACNNDVVCPEADDWRNEIPSVGVISTGGSTFCTGFMVNNTSYDLTPYFMTANHCGISSGNASSLVVYWNFESPTCGQQGGGSLADAQVGGATFRSAYSPSDFTLVQLNQAPNPAWNVSYAGWDRSTNNPTSAVAIHHPNTDEKSISWEYAPCTTTSYLGTSIPGDGTHVRVIDWDDGTTEPGSSGSPLFDQNHRVVGQLHGGYAACGNDDSDWYGRISVSWNGGGSAASRLSNWLDPTSTGATTVDTISGLGMSVTPGNDVTHFGVVGGPFTMPAVVYTLSNPSPDPIDYSVELNASFGILLNGGTAPVTGTIPGSGGSANVTVTVGPDVNSLGAGIYVETIDFVDITNTKTTSRVHTVEIGQTLISVTPSSDLQTSGPIGGPFPGTQIYTVTSQRPTPVDAQVSANQPWITLNGGAGPITLNLSGTGDYDTITVGVNPALVPLTPSIYLGTVTFTNLDSGAGDTSRAVTLDVGRISASSTDTPIAINDNSTITSTITLNEDYCIGNVEVDVDITHTYIGDLIIELESPNGTVVRLHNRTGGSANDINTTYADSGATAPDGPGALADYILETTAGDWVLTVSDNAGSDTGLLNSWTVRISPTATGCEIPELIYSYPLDTNPGWSTQGLWAYGTPLGLGSHNKDPNAGHTGSSVYGYNLYGDYTNNMASTQYLTTTAIDCSNLLATQLRFYRWLGIEASSFDHATIEVSNDGSTWYIVWQHSTAALGDTSWQYKTYDISAVADGQSTVYLRWGIGPTDSGITYPGWNIDDVEIWGAPVAATCNNALGDMNGDGKINGGDIQQFVSCGFGGDATTSTCVCADTNLDDAINNVDIEAFVDCLLGLGCP